MKASLFFQNYYFTENLRLKIKRAKEQCKKTRNCRLREQKAKHLFFGGFLLTFSQSDC